MKKILDACCGGKMFYFDKNDPRVLFQDIRSCKTTLCDGREFEIKPDVVGDFRSMEFPDGTFSLVIFDPPHLLRNVGQSKFADIYGSLNAKAKPAGWQHIKYGALGQTDWKETLQRGFAECFRVLKQSGFLIFKWSELDIKVSEILKLTPQKPIIGHQSGKRNLTHWILFQKSEEFEDKPAEPVQQLDLFNGEGYIEPKKPTKFCRSCKNRERWQCGGSWFQYCGARKSKRTKNGLLKIKVNTPACAMYEQEEKGGVK